MAEKRSPKTEWGRIKPIQTKRGLRYWAGEPVGVNEKGNVMYRGAPEGTFTSRAKAKEWLNRRRVEREGEREVADAEKLDATFGYWLERWLGHHRRAWETGRLSPNGFRAYEGSARNWIERIMVDDKPLTKIKIRNINTQVLEKVQANLRQMRGVRNGRLSPASSQKAELNIYSVLKLAVDEGAIVKNPFKNRDIQVNNEKFHRELGDFTEDMLHQLIDAMPAEYRAAIFLFAYTGLRAGEVWGLQVKDLHFDSQRVSIKRQLSATKDDFIRDDKHEYLSGRAHPVGPCLKCPEGAKEIPFGTRIRLGVELRPPKPKRAKTLDLHSFVIDELKKHLELRQPQRPDDWLFVDQRSRRYGAGLPVSHVNWYSYYFKPLVASFGWTDEVGVHTLRHFCGSYHLMLGYPEYVVQTMLDHSSAEMTRLYSHLVKGMASQYHGRAEAAYNGRKVG